MSLKLVDYMGNKEQPYYTYITLGAVVVLGLCILGLTATFIYDLLMESNNVFSLREDYLNYKPVMPDSAMQLHPHT